MINYCIEEFLMGTGHALEMKMVPPANAEKFFLVISGKINNRLDDQFTQDLADLKIGFILDDIVPGRSGMQIRAVNDASDEFCPFRQKILVFHANGHAFLENIHHPAGSCAINMAVGNI